MKSIVLEPTGVEVYKSTFRTAHWKYFYADVEEEYPPNIPKHIGKEVFIS